jgi:hypothetical protein
MFVIKLFAIAVSNKNKKRQTIFGKKKANPVFLILEREIREDYTRRNGERRSNVFFLLNIYHE